MHRKILLSIIGILIIICTILLSYEKINKTKEVNDKGMFAIFLEEEKDSGRYQKSNLKTWPTEDEYTINMLKSYCENGSILRWNNETKKLSLKVTGTDKCYVYFDKAEVGSAKHPHLIQTIEDLVRLSNDVNGGKTYAGEYFLLTNDLDFNDPSDYEDANRIDFQDINGINGNEPLIKELTTGSGFNPIGNGETNSFQGIFDGNNKIIDNLYINNNEVKANIGLFGYIYNSNISNLEVSGNITSSVIASIGGIIDVANGNVTVTNLINRVNVVSESNSWDAAGIIGSAQGNDNSIILKNCKNYGNITGSYNPGGIVGYVYPHLTLINCENYGVITNNVGDFSGGLIGVTNGGIIKIINSFNIATVSGKFFVGGLIGGDMDGNSEILINNSDNEGNIENKDSQSRSINGGLIGIIRNKAYIINSYNKGNINNNSTVTNSCASGLIGNTGNNSKIILLNSYNVGNINLPLEITNYGNGIYMGDYTSSNRTVIFNNIYNLGTIKAKNSWNIGLLPSVENSNINHVYYEEGTDSGSENLKNMFTALAKNTMQSQTFVDTLNQNIEEINLEEIDESLKDYTLSKWELGKNGYPTLDF